jgi:hypothetical protein
MNQVMTKKESVEKVCSKCGTPQPKEKCLPCAARRMKAYRQAHPERVKASQRKSCKKNAEAIRIRANKWYRDNHARALKYWADRRKNNPEAILDGKLKAAFGISFKHYQAMLESQDSKCAICGVPANELRKKLAVDHCHTTNKVRALLCHNCNVGLGNFKHNTKILTKAIDYIYEHSIDKIALYNSCIAS